MTRTAYGEQEIQAKGLDAPRLTPDAIDAAITAEQYHVFPGTTLTVCCLTLRNGFCVTGQSAAASPENFDAEVGRKIARADARDKIWMLEGYLLREQLAAAERAPVVTCSRCGTPLDRAPRHGILTHPDTPCPASS